MAEISEGQANKAAQILWNNWQGSTRLDGLPDDCRPATRRDGYAVQAAVARAAGQPAVGWKIAATSEAGQKHINVDGPLAGRLLRDRVLPPGTPIPFVNNLMRVAEAEICFRLARDLPAKGSPYSPADATAAVASAHPSIEIPDSRYNDFPRAGAPQLIADTACANWLAIGPAFAETWRSLDLAAHKIEVSTNGSFTRSGTGAAVLGDPRIAFAWIANELVANGEALRQGDYVTTGTWVVPVPIKSGDTIAVDYGSLGKFAVTIA
jgi:2-keto-4-pentenoate hydratase